MNTTMILISAVHLYVFCLFISRILGTPLNQNKTQSLDIQVKSTPSIIKSINDKISSIQPADLFYRTFSNFTVQQTNSSACRIQTGLYITHLKNNSYWASKMSDSWYKYPSGVLSGSIYQMGVYDECVDVQYPVQGQYCITDIQLNSTLTNKNYKFIEPEKINTWDNSWHKILGWVDYQDQIPRNLMKFGICIPASCSAIDLQKSLQLKLDENFLPEHIKAIASVNPILCSTKKDLYPVNNGYYITWTAFSLIFFVCCCATFYHLKKLFKRQENKNKNIDDGIYLSFSIIKNCKDLLTYDKDNELNLLNGFKVLVMIFVLFGHRFLNTAATPFSYPEKLELLYNIPLLTTSMNLVDPFFFMSGFLTYIVLIPVFKTERPLWMKLFMPLVYRILRMMPSYIAVMAFTAFILPHFGNGPLWQQKTWHEADNCKENWWSNLLYISNFIDFKYQCLIASWYISCDLQFYIGGILIAYLYTRNHKLGFGTLGVILTLSLIMPIYVTYTQKLDGLLKVDVPFLLNPRNSVTFDKAYRPSYLRATPYLIGLAMAFIIEKIKESKFKMSYNVVYVGTFIVSVVSLLVQFYGAKFYQRNRSYDPLENAFYASISHCTWALIGCWMVFCHFTTGYGPLTKLLSNRFVVVMGRLSYCVYLVNLTVMIISTGSERTPVHASFTTLINSWMYDALKSYLVAALLHLIIDAPISDLIRIAFGRKKKQSSEQR
ncbi:nose resistant to fluoxetine protein 6-like [Daktulosphaira vitifoliae]|uniref:nose resistant to fluoxetine protein 6-like n=1 Tax=Daktulosphaira vitifoliae TaxID=58002 RepID=UPI0021AAC019|nr:nose resistant to fluoxetine protein 6-like [Daktulosphaira vitifoliae]